MGVATPAPRSSRQTLRPSLPRQQHVQNDQIVTVDGGLIERLFAVAGDIHRIGLFAQAFGDEPGHTLFVLHQQDAHPPPHFHFPRTEMNRR